MNTIIAWCTAHWQLISLVALFVAAVLNSVTRHFSAGHPRIVPIIGVILEALSFLTSRGTRSGLPGPLGRLKSPLQNVPPKLEAVTARQRISGLTLVLTLVLCLGLAPGCTSGVTLADAHVIVTGLSKVTLTTLHVQCMAAAQRCKAQGSAVATCGAWQECDQLRSEFVAGVEKVEEGVLYADKALKRAREKGWLK